MYFKKVGRLDLLKRALENTELLTEEDIDKIVEKTTSYIDAQGSTINTRAHIDTAKENLDKVKATLERAISLMDEAQKPEAERSPDFDPTKVPSEAELDVLRQNYAQAEADYQTAQQTAEHVNGTIFNPYMRNGELMSAEEIREDITKRAAQVW
jgi:multidrug resistance efflux pump